VEENQGDAKIDDPIEKIMQLAGPGRTDDADLHHGVPPVMLADIQYADLMKNRTQALNSLLKAIRYHEAIADDSTVSTPQP